MASPIQRADAILRRLVRKEADIATRKVLAKVRPEDIAAAMEHLTLDEQRRLYHLVDNRDVLAEVLTHLSEESVRELTRQMTKDEVVDLLERMEPDDATDVVDYLSDELRVRVVAELEATGEAELDDVLELHTWPPDTAGGIMSSVVFNIRDHASCGEAIAELQARSEDLENIYYLYIVDIRDRLVGVISLRSLLIHPSSTPLISIMTREVISVSPEQDQEEVARVVARYDLLGIPVIDSERRLLGIVTVDDIIDVIREEADEDLMLMAGVQEADTRQGSIFRLARFRAGWLLATVVGGVVASELVGLFEDTLHTVALLAGFMSVVNGMGGNVGIQSATLTIRGIATGQVEVGGAGSFLWREVRVGMVLGLFFGLLLGTFALARHFDQPIIGLSVATSVFIAVSIASLLGSGLPVVVERFGYDPAVATGPFVTSAVDILGIGIFLSVAKFLLWMIGSS